MDGHDFAVRATDARFLELLRGYLGEIRVEKGSGEVVFSADCGVDKRLPGGKVARGVGRLYVDALPIFSGPVREEMAGRLVGGIRDMATAHSHEFFRIRAAGVAMDGGALVLPSAPQPHLPALGAMLVRSGAGYLGDEIVNIDPVLRRAHGIRLPLLLDARDLAHFPELGREPLRRRQAAELERLEARTPRRPVRLEELGGLPSPPVPVRWIVFPDFRPGGPTELELLAGSVALFRFTEAALNLHVWADRGLILMQGLLRTAAVARLSIGSLPEAAELLATAIPRLTTTTPAGG